MTPDRLPITDQAVATSVSRLIADATASGQASALRYIRDTANAQVRIGHLDPTVAQDLIGQADRGLNTIDNNS